MTEPVEAEVTQPVEDETIEHMETSVHEGLQLLAKRLVIYSNTATSLPQSAVELRDLDTQGVYFKEVCDNYE